MANLKPECAAVQDIVTAQFHRLDRVRVLEAGCGSNSAFRFEPNVHITGLDLSESQLQRNTTLDEKHQGDLQTYAFPAGSFDMIICWNVLEHLPQPEKALDRFAQWLAPNGVMILALPNVRSATGLATKFTLHWFHVWWYRHICHFANAGKNGHGPFPTYLRASLSLPRLAKYAEERRLRVLFSKAYGPKGRKGKGERVREAYRWLCLPAQVLTLGKVSAFNDSVMLVLQKDALALGQD